MSKNIFSPQDVLKIAIAIEENGKDFYTRMAIRVKDGSLKGTLNFLAEEEDKHRKIFKDLLDNIKDNFIVESYPGEYEAYIKALSQQYIFAIDLVKKKAKEGFAKKNDLLKFALDIERDSIVLYQEMKDLVLFKKDALNKIIEEERKHYLLIWNILKKEKERL